MPAVYKKLGVEFDYPENWTVTEEETIEWPKVVTVQTADSAFWMLQIHEMGTPRELAAESLKTMQKEYSELESDVVTELIEDTEVVGFDMHFYCYDFLVQARVRSLELGKLTLLLLYQGEDRDFDRNAPVFNAMLVSLLRRFKNQKE